MSSRVGIPTKFVQAVHFTPMEKQRRVDLIVLHSMESSEKPDTAENVAAWFADANRAPMASAHYCVDNNSVVQCVRDEDVAWHAPGANSRSIGVEHAGRAAQSESDWLDDYSLSMLRMSAALVARLCERHGIPVRMLSPADLKHGDAGITTHAAVSVAFRKSTHWDPGPSFPTHIYLSMVLTEMTRK